MIGIDGSPLRWGPRSVASVVRGWLRGWPPDVPVRLLLPRGTEAPDGWSPRWTLRDDAASTSPWRFRRRLPRLVRRAGVDAFLAPWAAFPDGLPREMPVVATVHEVPFGPRGALEGRVRAWRHRRRLRIGLRRGVTWIVPSEATRRDLRALFPDADARLAPPGFDPLPWDAARREPDAPPYAVMVGLGHGRRGAWKKGLDVVLDAWPRAGLEGWRLALVGSTGARLPAFVDARRAVDDAALRRLVAGASMLVYPSRSEGFGFPPLEAMAAGVPVLAAEAGAIPETVGAAAWLVRPGDPDALAEGLSRLASDAALRETLVVRGRERARAFPDRASAEAVLAAFGEPR